MLAGLFYFRGPLLGRGALKAHEPRRVVLRRASFSADFADECGWGPGLQEVAQESLEVDHGLRELAGKHAGFVLGQLKPPSGFDIGCREGFKGPGVEVEGRGPVPAFFSSLGLGEELSGAIAFQGGLAGTVVVREDGDGDEAPKDEEQGTFRRGKGSEGLDTKWDYEPEGVPSPGSACAEPPSPTCAALRR